MVVGLGANFMEIEFFFWRRGDWWEGFAILVDEWRLLNFKV